MRVVAIDPSPQFEKHRRAVFVGRDRCPKGEEGEILQDAVDLIEYWTIG
jgi:hypothetical protein